MVIDIPVIKELALTASIGVAVLIFTNLLLLPVLGDSERHNRAVVCSVNVKKLVAGWSAFAATPIVNVPRMAENYSATTRRCPATTTRDTRGRNSARNCRRMNQTSRN